MEDSVQNVIQPEKTQAMKHAGRISFLSQTENFCPGLNSKLGIRVNSLYSLEFKYDLECLSKLKNLKWNFIIVPKIDKRSDVDLYCRIFDRTGILFDEVIPIIETHSGFENLKDLISEPPSKRFHRACFGHIDYNLNVGNWPFLEHQSIDYWRLVKHITSHLKKSGYGFVNGAIMDLDSEAFIKDVLLRTCRLCDNGFSQIAISFSQVKRMMAVKKTQTDYMPESLRKLCVSELQKIELAKITLSLFEENIVVGKSFSVDKKQRLFISPQHYIAAKNYLKQNGYT